MRCWSRDLPWQRVSKQARNQGMPRAIASHPKFIKNKWIVRHNTKLQSFRPTANINRLHPPVYKIFGAVATSGWRTFQASASVCTECRCVRVLQSFCYTFLLNRLPELCRRWSKTRGHPRAYVPCDPNDEMIENAN